MDPLDKQEKEVATFDDEIGRFFCIVHVVHMSGHTHHTGGQ